MLIGLASACKEVHMTVRTGCVRVWVGAHASISSTFAVSLKSFKLYYLLHRQVIYLWTNSQNRICQVVALMRVWALGYDVPNKDLALRPLQR